MAKLSAILFDVDDTLFSTTHFAALARQRAAEAMVRQGLRLPVSEVRRELNEVIAEFTSNYGQHFDKLLLRLPPASYAGVNRALIIAAGIMAYHATKAELQPFPDVLPFLRRVHEQGEVVLGVITHGLELKQAEKLLLLKVVPFLHPGAIFISDQVGISKPNPKLYQRACAAMGLVPAEVMYVGDNPLHDVDPVNALGMVSVRLHRDNRFEGVQGRTRPRYEIGAFDELVPVLEQDFGLVLPP
ncbi:MAG: HAD-IA family hydrolase [Planctomycetes bacterium]|nr:HAD-IA family hydrolase [Planctomycetota bacterium]